MCLYKWDQTKNAENTFTQTHIHTSAHSNADAHKKDIPFRQTKQNLITGWRGVWKKDEKHTETHKINRTEKERRLR